MWGALAGEGVSSAPNLALELTSYPSPSLIPRLHCHVWTASSKYATSHPRVFVVHVELSDVQADVRLPLDLLLSLPSPGRRSADVLVRGAFNCTEAFPVWSSSTTAGSFHAVPVRQHLVRAGAIVPVRPTSAAAAATSAFDVLVRPVPASSTGSWRRGRVWRRHVRRTQASDTDACSRRGHVRRRRRVWSSTAAAASTATTAAAAAAAVIPARTEHSTGTISKRRDRTQDKVHRAARAGSEDHRGNRVSSTEPTTPPSPGLAGLCARRDRLS